MGDVQFVEVAADGHLALPEDTFRKLRLGPAMKFQLLADDDAMLVMKLLTGPAEHSSVREAELRLQQNAVAEIGDDSAEDLYNEDA